MSVDERCEGVKPGDSGDVDKGEILDAHKQDEKDTVTPIEGTCDCDNAERNDNEVDEPSDKVSSTRFLNSALRSYPSGAKVLVAFALFTIACIGIYQVRSLVAPAFFAFTLVLTVRPIQRSLTRRRVPQWLAGTIAIVVLIVVLLAVGALFTWSMSGLPDLINSYTYRFEALANDVFAFADKRGFSTDRIQEESARISPFLLLFLPLAR